MRLKRIAVIGLGVVACVVLMAVASSDERQNQTTGLVKDVRIATRAFFDVNAAMAAGYSSAGSCVSGPEVGAMGVHFPNGQLVEDGELDADHPEILVYEPRNGRFRLLGVEFIVIAEQWDAKKIGPPVLDGQHFHYVGSPNRYGLPAFYELHVWAWRNNPNGMFVDWNPAVSCEDFSSDSSTHAMHGGSHH